MAAPAGYSGTPLPKKLGIVDGVAFATVHAPADFADTLGPVPTESHQLREPATDAVVVAFYVEAAAMVGEWPALTNAVGPFGVIWVAWPKKASKVPTDITEDVVRAELLPSGWVDVKVCAIDSRWSGLKLVLRKELRPPRPKG